MNPIRLGLTVAPLSAVLLASSLVSPAATVFLIDRFLGSPEIRNASGDLRPVTIGSEIFPGEAVVTGADEGVHVTISNAGSTAGTFCGSGQGEILVDEYDYTPTERGWVIRSLNAISGFIISLNPERFMPVTRGSAGGIRGTWFQVDQIDASTENWTLWEGGPLDLYPIADWNAFNDALFTNPLDKGVHTMDVAAFNAAANTAGVSLYQFLSGSASPAATLTAPGTMIPLTNGVPGQPGPTTSSQLICIPEPANATAGLLPLILLLCHRRKPGRGRGNFEF